jgi:hypothetical protein
VVEGEAVVGESKQEACFADTGISNQQQLYQAIHRIPTPCGHILWIWYPASMIIRSIFSSIRFVADAVTICGEHLCLNGLHRWVQLQFDFVTTNSFCFEQNVELAFHRRYEKMVQGKGLMKHCKNLECRPIFGCITKMHIVRHPKNIADQGEGLSHHHHMTLRLTGLPTEKYTSFKVPYRFSVIIKLCAGTWPFKSSPPQLVELPVRSIAALMQQLAQSQKMAFTTQL